MLDEIIDGIFLSDAASVISRSHRQKLVDLEVRFLYRFIRYFYCLIVDFARADRIGVANW